MTDKIMKWREQLTPKQKKTLSLAYKIIVPAVFIAVFFLIWQILCWTRAVHPALLPSPSDTMHAFVKRFDMIIKHTGITLAEAFGGLSAGMIVGFLLAVLMDRFRLFNYGFKPLIIISQTIPTIAIAPLIVSWFGVGIAPKIFVVALTTFFPIAIGLADGYMNVDKDMVDLMRSMGASKFQIFTLLKLPSALPNFFSSLKISATYSIVGGVISEWVGATGGLGWYITRMQNMKQIDAMFAIIFWIILLSLALMGLVGLLRKLIIRWDKKEK